MKSEGAHEQLPLWAAGASLKSDQELASAALRLHAMWQSGRLGGEHMPEDVHPPVPRDSEELAIYFTLGMSLNYQRNSYSLWRACTAAFDDQAARWVFDPQAVAAAELARLSEVLVHYRVALQPNRHPHIWMQNARGLVEHTNASVRTLFENHQYDLGAVKNFIAERKSSFPYLCGPKICNYWLYVMSSYMAWPTRNRASLTVAPDTHVKAASIRLGLVPEDLSQPELPSEVARRWSEVLAPTELLPIDIHTPLWLWSRAGFPEIA